MKNINIKIMLGILFAFALAISISFSSAAVLVDSVNQGILYPGQEASLNVKVKNTFDKNIEDVSMNLIFSGLDSTGKQILSQFSTVGSSSDNVDEIEDDEAESFNFKIKASSTTEPGEYTLPYILEYDEINSSNTTIRKQVTGTLGIRVNSKIILDFSVSQDKKVIGMKDKVSLKIINKGFGEIKFVSVKINPSVFTLLSDSKVYIGSIASDDFDTASFDAILGKNPSLNAIVTYKDFENNDKTENINLPLTSYTQEEAIKLGIISKNNTPMIIGFVIVLVIIWIVYRMIRKRIRDKRRMNKEST